MMRFRTTSRPLTMLCACLVGCMMLASCSATPRGASGPTPTSSAATPLSTAWTTVLNQIGPNGEVSLATALQAYTLGFGPLPGVPAPARDNGLIPSGTLAVDMILRHFDELTPAQRQAVLQRLGYAASASAQAATRASSVQSLSRPLAARVAPAAPTPVPTPVPTDAPGTAPYRAMLDEFIPKLNGLLKVTLTLPTVLVFDPNTPFKAYTLGLDAQGQQKGIPVLCRINLNPGMNAAQLDNQRLVLAHELTHCYEDQIQGNMTIHYLTPNWLIEGAATWTGAVVSGATDTTSWLQPYWADWLELEHPDHPLFQRSYNAIGFFALLDQAGISPWSVLPAMLLSQLKGKAPDNDAAYQAATAKAPQAVLDQWASSYEREPALGAAWDLKGPAILPVGTYGQIADQPANIANGQLVTFATPAYTAALYNPVSTADVLQVQISGTSRLKDGGGVERVPSATGNYCTKQGGCACPPGSAYQGPALSQLTGLVHLGLTGGPQGATGIANGMTLQQFCGKRKLTGVPKITGTFCQQVLSIAEANQLMQPPTAAGSIRVDASPKVSLGSCNYEYAQFKSVVTVIFAPYKGPAGDAQAKQAALAAMATQQLSQVQGAQTTTTAVTGVGDAAVFITGNIASPPLRLAALIVIDGPIVLECGNYNVGSASFASQQTALTQVCQLVVNRLDP